MIHKIERFKEKESAPTTLPESEKSQKKKKKSVKFCTTNKCLR